MTRYYSETATVATPVPKQRLAERVGVVQEAESEDIRRGLAALFDL